MTSPRTTPPSPSRAPLTQSARRSGRRTRRAARLLLIGSLGVAILLAFAVFLALVVRDDVAAEVARLDGCRRARRRDRVTFLVLEAAIPAVDRRRDRLARPARSSWRARRLGGGGSPSADRPAAPCSAPDRSLAAVIVIVVDDRRPPSSRRRPGRSWGGGVRTIVAVVLTAVVVLGWQLASAGPLDAEALRRRRRQPGRRAAATGARVPRGAAFSRPRCRRCCGRSPGGFGARAAAAPAVAALARPRPGTAGRDAHPAGVQHRGDRLRDVLVGHAARGIDDAAAYRSGLDLRVPRARDRAVDRAVGRAGRSLRAARAGRHGRPGLSARPAAAQPGGPRRHHRHRSRRAARRCRAGAPTSPRRPSTSWPRDWPSTEPPGGWRVGGHRLPPASPR